MTAISKTFAYGTLEADAGIWLLAREQVTPVVNTLFPFVASLKHKAVSVIDRMGIPQG